jgi:hypothetical protein
MRTYILNFAGQETINDAVTPDAASDTLDPMLHRATRTAI